MGKSAIKGLFHIILITATIVLAVVTIIASRSGYYAPAESVIMPLLGLALPVLLLCNLIVAVCWAFAAKNGYGFHSSPSPSTGDA